MKIFKFVNNGNNCYINSSLQVLLHLYKFNNHLLKINESFNDYNTIFSQYCNILKLFDNLNIEDETLINPYNFYKLIHNKLKFNTKQQDINEFIYLFLDTIEKEINNNLKINFNINSFFEFNNLYETKCINCNYKNKSNQKYITLDLYINKYENSLQYLINNINNDDKLNDYKCDKCKKINTSIKKNNYNNFKNYLFIYICPYNQHNKIQNSNNFIINDIININNNKFKPISIINHQGSLAGGHYVNHTLNFKKQWKYISDEHISNDISKKNISPVLVLLQKF